MRRETTGLVIGCLALARIALTRARQSAASQARSLRKVVAGGGEDGVCGVAVSVRTLQRHKNTPVVHLDVQQSGRTWKFAEILAKATRVLGSQDEAEQWLRRPAIGLDQKRPIDLLTTPAGVQLVEDYLGRLEYDVYT